MRDQLEVLPGVGVGPFRLGDTRGRSIEAAERTGLALKQVVRWAGQEATLVVGSQMQLHFRNDVVSEIEVSQPDVPGVRDVVLDDVLLLRGASRTVIKLLEPRSSPTRTAEYPATAEYPESGFTLWMDAKPSDAPELPFQSVGIFPSRTGNPG